MERMQKQITGRAPVSYSWDNGQYSRARSQTRSRDAYRSVNVPAAKGNGRVTSRKRRQNDRMRLVALELATIAVLVLMLSMVIGKLNYIANIKKQYNIDLAVKDGLKASVNIAETQLSNLSSDSSIEYLARTKLNMIMPDEISVHVLSNVRRTTPDTTHTAEASIKP